MGEESRGWGALMMMHLDLNILVAAFLTNSPDAVWNLPTCRRKAHFSPLNLFLSCFYAHTCTDSEQPCSSVYTTQTILCGKQVTLVFIMKFIYEDHTYYVRKSIDLYVKIFLIIWSKSLTKIKTFFREGSKGIFLV